MDELKLSLDEETARLLRELLTGHLASESRSDGHDLQRIRPPARPSLRVTTSKPAGPATGPAPRWFLHSLDEAPTVEKEGKRSV